MRFRNLLVRAIWDDVTPDNSVGELTAANLAELLASMRFDSGPNSLDYRHCLSILSQFDFTMLFSIYFSSFFSYALW